MLAEEVTSLMHKLLVCILTIFSQTVRLREAAGKSQGGDDSAEGSSDEEDIEEELGYISPLDVVDPYVTFKAALTSTYYVLPMILALLMPQQRSIPNAKRSHISGRNDFT